MRIVVPHFAAAAVVVALALPALAGCESAPAPAPATTTSTGAPVFASDEEALAAATEAYAAYLEVVDTVLANGGTDVTPLSDVASGDALVAEVRTAAKYSHNGYKSAGASKFDSLTIQSVEYVNGKARARTYVCVDVAEVDVVDSNGTSIIPVDRVERYPLEIAFESVKPGSSHLLITSSETWTGTNFC